jgi:hypothetical protein
MTNDMLDELRTLQLRARVPVSRGVLAAVAAVGWIVAAGLLALLVLGEGAIR